MAYNTQGLTPHTPTPSLAFQTPPRPAGKPLDLNKEDLRKRQEAQ